MEFIFHSKVGVSKWKKNVRRTDFKIEHLYIYVRFFCKPLKGLTAFYSLYSIVPFLSVDSAKPERERGNRKRERERVCVRVCVCVCVRA